MRAGERRGVHEQGRAGVSHVADEQYQVYNERPTKARKPHACDACHETIAPSHVYMHVGIVFEGSGETIKRGMRCQAIHEHLRDLGDFDVWPDERLDCGEEYRDHWRTDPPSWVAALAFQTPDEAQAGWIAGST